MDIVLEQGCSAGKGVCTMGNEEVVWAAEDDNGKVWAAETDEYMRDEGWEVTKATEGVFVNEFRTLINGCENPAEHVGMDNQICGGTR